MTLHRSTFRKFAFSTFLLTLPLNPAFAQDAAVAERLKGLLANQGVEFAWTGVSGDASSMVLKGVTVKPAAESEALAIGDVTLEGVSEANGGYAIDTVSTQGFSRTEDGATVDVSPFSIHGMTLPAEGSTDPLGSIVMYRSAELPSFSVKVGDRTAFSMDNFSVQVTPRRTATRWSFPAARKGSPAISRWSTIRSRRRSSTRSATRPFPAAWGSRALGSPRMGR